jgi:preprotein translocase subunit SecE
MKKQTQKSKRRKAEKNRNLSAEKQAVGSSAAIVEKRPVRQVAPSRASKKEPVKKGVGLGFFLKYVEKAGQFLKEAKLELKKVKWPTRKELLASTGVVIFLVIVISLFLGLVDFGLIKVIRNIVRLG